MSQPKHTRGPWKVENHVNEVGPYTSAALEIWSDNRHICTVNEHVDDLKIDQANAHLIAAAPEMLEVLESLVDRLDLDGLLEKMSDELKLEIAKTAAVLAKARGES